MSGIYIRELADHNAPEKRTVVIRPKFLKETGKHVATATQA